VLLTAFLPGATVLIVRVIRAFVEPQAGAAHKGPRLTFIIADAIERIVCLLTMKAHFCLGTAFGHIRLGVFRQPVAMRFNQIIHQRPDLV